MCYSICPPGYLLAMSVWEGGLFCVYQLVRWLLSLFPLLGGRGVLMLCEVQL